MLILDRFDLVEHPDGRIERLGFEDIAALAGLRVRDVLSDRKYQGSYQRVAELLRQLRLPGPDLGRFFAQLAFTVMVRNGDAHLKNFGVLYRAPGDIRLAPMFDVVTTSIYSYARYTGGPEMQDRTLALKWYAGRHASRAYPTREELLDFGRRVCGVAHPHRTTQAIAAGMEAALADARQDERVNPGLLKALRAEWEEGLHYAA